MDKGWGFLIYQVWKDFIFHFIVVIPEWVKCVFSGKAHSSIFQCLNWLYPSQSLHICPLGSLICFEAWGGFFWEMPLLTSFIALENLLQTSRSSGEVTHSRVSLAVPPAVLVRSIPSLQSLLIAHSSTGWCSTEEGVAW